MSIDIDKVKGWLRAAFAWVNTESAFILALAAGMWGYTYKAGHPDAPYGEFVAFVITLCGGFFWSRRKKQSLAIDGLKVQIGADPGKGATNG